MEPPYRGLDQAYDEPPMPSTATALDLQVGGIHYKLCKIQPIEYAMANDLNPIQANIVKYTTRAPDKGVFRKDIEKIKHYCDIWLELDGDKYD